MIQLAAVSYLNTKPFLQGLAADFTPEELQVTLLPPAACAQALHQGRADVALVPVAALLDAPAVHIMPDYCIGAEGRVDSVYLVSQRPLPEVTHLYLDPDSRTSNGLTQLLLARHWHLAPTLLRPPQPQTELQPQEAAVLIGDKAIGLAQHYPYVQDLAAAWAAYSGLPFVFAVWVYRPERLPAPLYARLQQALAWGFDHLPQVAAQWAAHAGLTSAQLLAYYQRSISYTLDTPKRQALTRFLSEVALLQGTPAPTLHWGSGLEKVGFTKT